MNWLKTLQFKYEPAAWLSFVRLVVPTLQIFGYINWSTDQLVNFFASTEAFLFLIQRSVVTPNAKLSDATVEQAKDVPPGPKP
jgi:hypothetical protein